MSLAIPPEIQYTPSLPVLPPETVNTNVVVVPSNGASFSPSSSSQIIFDIPAAAFMDPNSIYLRFKLAITNSTTSSYMKGVPAASPIFRLETLFGSQIIESISNYNILYHDMVNLQMNIAQKVGTGGTYGFLDPSSNPTFSNMNGRYVPATGETIYCSIPLPCILSSCEKLIPLFSMPNVRLQLTLDSNANVFTTSTPSYTMTNVELCFDQIRFGANVENLVRAMGQQLYIKSQSWAISGASVAASTSGSLSLVYNQRLSSIKGLLAHFGGSSVNGLWDSVDVTTSNGSMFYNIAGINYPAKPLDTLNNKGGVLAECRAFVTGQHNSVTANNMSILPVEFNYTSASTTTTTLYGKFYFATNTEKIQGSNKSLLTGISTQNSPITLNLSINTATAEAHNILLMCNYDALIEVDTVLKQAMIKQ